MVLPGQTRIEGGRTVTLRTMTKRAAPAADLGGACQIDLRQLCSDGSQGQSETRCTQYDQSVPSLHDFLLSALARVVINDASAANL
jgi:hypothetical protein